MRLSGGRLEGEREDSPSLGGDRRGRGPGNGRKRELFVVVSQHPSHKDVFWDVIPALYPEDAHDRARRLRPYAQVIDTRPAKELGRLARTTAPAAEAAYHELEKNNADLIAGELARSGSDARARLEATPVRQWTVDEIARRAGCGTETAQSLAPILREMFRHRYGPSFDGYLSDEEWRYALSAVQALPAERVKAVPAAVRTARPAMSLAVANPLAGTSPGRER